MSSAAAEEGLKARARIHWSEDATVPSVVIEGEPLLRNERSEEGWAAGLRTLPVMRSRWAVLAGFPPGMSMAATTFGPTPEAKKSLSGL